MQGKRKTSLVYVDSSVKCMCLDMLSSVFAEKKEGCCKLDIQLDENVRRRKWINVGIVRRVGIICIL